MLSDIVELTAYIFGILTASCVILSFILVGFGELVDKNRSCMMQSKDIQENLKKTELENKKLEANLKALQEKQEELNNKEAKINKKEDALNDKEAALKRAREELVVKYKTAMANLAQDNEAKIEARANELVADYGTLCKMEKLAFENFEKEIEPALAKRFSGLLGGVKIGRLHNLCKPNNAFTLTNLNVSAEISHTNANDNNKKPYQTSLTGCTCYDFRYNHVPACKHMLFLARSLGILQVYRELHKEEFEQVRDEAERYVGKKSCPKKAAADSEWSNNSPHQ